MAEKIRVLQGESLEAGPSTSGMIRSQAFVTESLWVGRVQTEANAFSDWHHHGEHTTYGCVVQGRLRFEFGPGGEENSRSASETISWSRRTPSTGKATQARRSSVSWSYAMDPGQL